MTKKRFLEILRDSNYEKKQAAARARDVARFGKDAFALLGADIRHTATVAHGRTLYLPEALALVAKRAVTQERARIRKALAEIPGVRLWFWTQIMAALRAPKKGRGR